jgi:hypothetical protein
VYSVSRTGRAGTVKRIPFNRKDGGEVSMSRITFGSKWGKVKTVAVKDKTTSPKSAEEVVRNLKNEERGLPKEEYRERSLSLHGLVCARCGRDFDETKRCLLTVHHKDGNHQNNPPDGSNWENLCVYCHEDVHSREILGDYLQGTSTSEGHESSLVYGDHAVTGRSMYESGSLGEKLRIALERKGGKNHRD